MSDRPSDLEFKLQHIIITVQDVGEWYDLGLQLGLPDSALAAIASHPDVRGHKRLMLSEWLKRDTEASWDKLAGALSVIGENVVAANVRSRFMKAGAASATPRPIADASNKDDKTCKPLLLIIHTHLTVRQGKLNSQFIVTDFSILHAGGPSLFRFQTSTEYEKR
jgi:hypothetical protein